MKKTKVKTIHLGNVLGVLKRSGYKVKPHEKKMLQVMKDQLKREMNDKQAVERGRLDIF